MEYFFTWNSLIEFGVSFIEFGVSFIEFGVSFIEFGVSFIEFGVSFIEFGVLFIEFGVSFIEFGQPPIMHNAKCCHATTNKLDIFLIGSLLYQFCMKMHITRPPYSPPLPRGDGDSRGVNICSFTKKRY